MQALGGQLTDESYTPGFSEQATVLAEDEGCTGEAATLQLAFWADAKSDGPPVVITEDIAGHRFTGNGSAYTLALLPAGSEIPKPPQDRLANLAQLVP